MKKILFVSNTDRHIQLCYIPYMKYLKDAGYIVHVATNTDVMFDYCDKKIKIPIHRNPFHIGNVIAISKLKKIILEEKYDLVSSSTPMGGFIARYASRKSRIINNTKSLYTVHGFHFFKGNSKINNFIFYNIEKHMSKFTDLLVTINKEDYFSANGSFYCDVKLIDGIGFNDSKLNKNLSKSEKNEFRNKLNLNKNDYVITYVAELSKRKRQMYLIKCLSSIKHNNIKLLLVGENRFGNKIHHMINKFHLNNKVKILGFRDDISEILDISDLVISVSSQEGLPLNVMEAMYKQKTIIVTDCRGNNDLITDGVNGRVVPVNDEEKLIKTILFLMNNRDKALKLGSNNNKIIKNYSINNILPKYVDIYNKFLK